MNALGLSEPFVVCIPNTNVAESADVIKNDAISNNAIIDKTMPSGIWLNTPNNCVSADISKISLCFLAVSIPNTPNTLNQIKLTITGTSNTPEINSRIERPFDTRAMKTPTNGSNLTTNPNNKASSQTSIHAFVGS